MRMRIDVLASEIAERHSRESAAGNAVATKWSGAVRSAIVASMPRSPFDPPYSGPEALRRALRSGHHFAGWELSGLLQDLDRQREHIETIIAGEDPLVAVEWLFAMVDSCRKRFVQLRDDGELLAWWEEDLVVAWIRARQKVNADSRKTAGLLLDQLWRLDEEASVADCLVNALNDAGLHALGHELLRRADEARDAHVREHRLRLAESIRRRRQRIRRRTGR